MRRGPGVWIVLAAGATAAVVLVAVVGVLGGDVRGDVPVTDAVAVDSDPSGAEDTEGPREVEDVDHVEVRPSSSDRGFGDGCAELDDCVRWTASLADIDPPVTVLLDAEVAVLHGETSVTAVDLVDGSVRWATPIPDEVGPPEVSGVSSFAATSDGEFIPTPTVPSTGPTSPMTSGDGGVLIRGAGGVALLEDADGDVRWVRTSQDLGVPDGVRAASMHDGIVIVSGGDPHAEGDDDPFVVPDDGAFVIGLDVTDGAEQWRERAGSVIHTVRGPLRAVGEQLLAHDPDGRLRWDGPGLGGETMPLLAGDVLAIAYMGIVGERFSLEDGRYLGEHVGVPVELGPAFEGPLTDADAGLFLVPEPGPDGEDTYFLELVEGDAARWQVPTGICCIGRSIDDQHVVVVGDDVDGRPSIRRLERETGEELDSAPTSLPVDGRAAVAVPIGSHVWVIGGVDTPSELRRIADDVPVPGQQEDTELLGTVDEQALLTDGRELWFLDLE